MAMPAKSGSAKTASVNSAQHRAPSPAMWRRMPDDDHGGGSRDKSCKGRAYHHHHGAVRYSPRTSDNASGNSCRGHAGPRDEDRTDMPFCAAIGWRSRATIAELPDGDTELSRLVGEVVLDAGTREHDDAIGIDARIWSLRLKGAALACLTQSGLKTICGTLRFRPSGRRCVRRPWAIRLQQHHVGIAWREPCRARPRSSW